MKERLMEQGKFFLLFLFEKEQCFLLEKYLFKC